MLFMLASALGITLACCYTAAARRTCTDFRRKKGDLVCMCRCVAFAMVETGGLTVSSHGFISLLFFPAVDLRYCTSATKSNRVCHQLTRAQQSSTHAMMDVVYPTSSLSAALGVPVAASSASVSVAWLCLARSRLVQHQRWRRMRVRPQVYPGRTDSIFF